MDEKLVHRPEPRMLAAEGVFSAIVLGSGAYLALYFVGVWVVPGIFQRFVVQPNELGYGVAMSFVSTMGGGFPQYVLENIPPESNFGLTGESMAGYRIVSTGIKEFDYPKGIENVYTKYAGTGGIPLDSLWKRVLFARTQSDINTLFTSYLQPESKIQIWRRVQDRVEQIAPFLRLDKDPYAVVSEGKQYWIQDAYTVSDHFPYSAPIRKV
jgi:uncharacterized membrane protein (UPF0182 family)